MASGVQYTRNLLYLIHLMSIRSGNQEENVIAHFAVENAAAKLVGKNLEREYVVLRC